MNTQTHLVLAAALLCRPVATTPKRSTTLSLANTNLANSAVLLGALLPDISLFIMWGQAKVRGITDDVIWRELYYSAFWQDIGAITNSIPVYGLIAFLGFMLGGRVSFGQSHNTSKASFGQVLVLLAVAAILHCLTDLPLHVDDGHAHFWPLSNWIFISPVSYWDVNHYASMWQPLEIAMAAICVVMLYRRFESVWVRAASILSLLSYAVLFAYWTNTLG